MFFIPSVRAGHSMFDLAGFIRMRLENAGVLMIDDIGVDTYSDERFYSYRRSVHRKEPDYGRHVHAIALDERVAYFTVTPPCLAPALLRDRSAPPAIARRRIRDRSPA